MSTVNPWLPPAPPEHPTAAAEPAPAPAAHASGIARPQLGVPAPRVGLPGFPVPANEALWWVGAHGGAGVSTLERLVPGSVTAGRAWPDPVTGIARCVLAARSNITGLRAAQTAMTQWAAGAAPLGVHLLGLVVVADAPGRLPRPLRDFLQVLAGGVPQIWRLDWADAWRVEPVPSTATAPRAVASTVADLIRLTNSLATVQGTPEERYPA